MSNFKVVLPDPEVSYDYRREKFRLLRNYVTPEYMVPTGFVSDGATTPKWTRLWFPKVARYLPAAIVHDYMYDFGIGTKVQADKLFRVNLKRCGVGKVRRFFMYYAVKWFGEGAF